jgi:hypothetical protein
MQDNRAQDKPVPDARVNILWMGGRAVGFCLTWLIFGPELPWYWTALCAGFSFAVTELIYAAVLVKLSEADPV